MWSSGGGTPWPWRRDDAAVLARRAVRNRHRHGIEQASRRWRGGQREVSVGVSCCRVYPSAATSSVVLSAPEGLDGGRDFTRELKIEVVSIRARGAAQSCEFSYFYGFKAPALRVLAHVRH
jgi:hypothetical protein